MRRCCTCAPAIEYAFPSCELNIASDSSSLIAANVQQGRELKKVPKVGRVREPVVLAPLDKLLPPGERDAVAVIEVDVQGADGVRGAPGAAAHHQSRPPCHRLRRYVGLQEEWRGRLGPAGIHLQQTRERPCLHARTAHRRRSVPSATQAAQSGRRSFTSSSRL